MNLEASDERRTEERGRAQRDQAESKARPGGRRNQGYGGNRGSRHRDPQADREPARDPIGKRSRRPRQAGRTQGQSQAQEKEDTLMKKEDRNRADARFHKVNQVRSGQ